MNFSKKLFNFVLLFLVTQTELFAGLKKETLLEDQDVAIQEFQESSGPVVTRSTQYQILQELAILEDITSTNQATLTNHETRITANEVTLSDHETRITDNETCIAANKVTLADHEIRITDLEMASMMTGSSSEVHNRTIYSCLLPNDISRAVVFNNDVTVSATDLFTLATADSLAVLGSVTSTLTAASGGITGIDFSNFSNFQSAVGTLNIDTNTFINGIFTVNESMTIQGDLIINGDLVIGSAATLTVDGQVSVKGAVTIGVGSSVTSGKDMILDGRCTKTLVNSGTISSDGKLTIQNYQNTSGAAVTNNAGATISSLGTGCEGTVTFKNNVGMSYGVVNTGAMATIESEGDIVFEQNSGQDRGVLNTTGAIIQCTGTGSVAFIENEGTDTAGIGVENTASLSKITGADGDIKFIRNKGDDVGVKNSGAGVKIEASGHLMFEQNSGGNHGVLNTAGALIRSIGMGCVSFIANEGVDSGGIGVENTDGMPSAASMITAANGDILFSKNQGDDKGVVNTGSGVEIKVTSTGTITFEKNSGATHGVLNTSAALIQTADGCLFFESNEGTGSGGIGVENTTSVATIKTIAGHIHFNKNKGLNTGVLNDVTGLVESSHNLFFDGNIGRDNSGVRNDNGGIVRATAARSVIYFRNNTGRDYGVRNHASTSGTTEIRTTDATAYPNNKTRIIFVGNSGGATDTINNSESGTANIIAGAATGIVGNGMICYDSQRNLDIAAGNVSPNAVVCAKDEELTAPVIDTINVDSTLNKTIVFDTAVTMDPTGGGTLMLGTGNELTVLALLTDKAGIQTVVAVASGTITPASYPTLDLTTGGSNVFDADIIVNDNLTVNEDLTITGNLTIKGGSLTVATGKTLTIQGDLLAHGLDMDRQVMIVGTASLTARNITLRNYQSSSMEAVRIEGTMTSAKCGTIMIHDNTTSAATKDGVLVTGSISADGSLVFKNNSSTATGADGIHISSASAISVGGNVNFIGNAGKDAGHGVHISGTSDVKSLSNLMIRSNSSDGAGHGFNVADTATVSGFNIVIEDNSSALGKEINVASTAKVHSCGTVLFDHDVIVSDDISGILQGRIIIDGNLTVDTDLEINGDLFVCGGNVTIDNGVKLTVTGDIVFDGQGDNKSVVIEGNIVGATTSDPGANNLIIKNYVLTGIGTMSAVSIPATGTIVTEQDIQILNNIGATGTTGTVGVFGGHAVNIIGSVKAKGSMKFHNNTGGQGGQSTGSGMAGSTGGHGVIASSSLTASDTISFVCNTGGVGGLGTDAAGGLGGSAIYIDQGLYANEITFKENIGGAGQVGNGTDMDGGAGGNGILFGTATDILSRATTVIAGNIGGAGGAATGTGNTGNGGDGAELVGSASIEVDSVLSIRDNVGGATDTGGTSGSGFVLNSSAILTVRGNKVIEGNTAGAANGGSAGSATILNGTCATVSGSNKIVYDANVTTSTIGSVTADVCVNGTLTVNSSETIYGDLFVNGSVTTGGSSYTLTVHGNVVFDGQNGNVVTIASSDEIVACNIEIKNYTATTAHAVNVSGTLTTMGDITIKNNIVNTFVGNGINVSGAMNATSGTILLRENKSSTDHGVEVSGMGSMEAMHIHFTKNSTSQVASHGVYIDEASLKAHDALRFTYNVGGATSGNGVVIGDMTATTLMAASLYIIVDCASQRQHVVFDSNTTKTDLYDATLMEFVHNPNGCTVDL